MGKEGVGVGGRATRTGRGTHPATATRSLRSGGRLGSAECGSESAELSSLVVRGDDAVCESLDALVHGGGVGVDVGGGVERSGRRTGGGGGSWGRVVARARARASQEAELYWSPRAATRHDPGTRSGRTRDPHAASTWPPPADTRRLLPPPASTARTARSASHQPPTTDHHVHDARPFLHGPGIRASRSALPSARHSNNTDRPKTTSQLRPRRAHPYPCIPAA